MMGKAGDWEDGFRKAQEIIDDGGAISKLEEWVVAQNEEPERGLKILDEVKAKAGLNGRWKEFPRLSGSAPLDLQLELAALILALVLYLHIHCVREKDLLVFQLHRAR